MKVRYDATQWSSGPSYNSWFRIQHFSGIFVELRASYVTVLQTFGECNTASWRLLDLWIPLMASCGGEYSILYPRYRPQELVAFAAVHSLTSLVPSSVILHPNAPLKTAFDALESPRAAGPLDPYDNSAS